MTVRAELPAQVEAHHALPTEALGEEARAVFDELLDLLEKGEARAAEPGPEGWRVNGWVKKGILLGFRLGRLLETEPAGPLSFVDKDTLLPRRWTAAQGVRVVPGGSAVRRGAHVAAGVVIMPRLPTVRRPNQCPAPWACAHIPAHRAHAARLESARWTRPKRCDWRFKKSFSWLPYKIRKGGAPRSR